MNLQKIYYFIKIVETLSLKKAADALFVSRQALSKQMQQLEEELGVCLLERITNRIVVTEAGIDRELESYGHLALVMKPMHPRAERIRHLGNVMQEKWKNK